MKAKTGVKAGGGLLAIALVVAVGINLGGGCCHSKCC